MIPIDSIFSPVRRVAYAVEQARVGQRTDFDKLTLDIETDGSIEPAGRAARGGRDPDLPAGDLHRRRPHRGAARRRRRGALDAGPGGGRRRRRRRRRGRPANAMDDILIEELELGVRSYNCLKRAGIQTVGDLVSKSEAELNAIPNFGKKSIDEVIETLARPRARAARRLTPVASRAMRHQKNRVQAQSRSASHRKALLRTSARRSSSTSGSRRPRRRPRRSSPSSRS